MSATVFSLVSLYGRYLRHCFTSAGLVEQTIDVDHETTICYWGPRPNSNKQSTHKQKPSLILIHGFGPAAMWQWRYQVQFFSSRCNVYVPNLIFFGGSTTKSSERSEVFQAVSIAKLLDKLRIDRFHVLGTSYGGFVAYHLAQTLGNRVEKVVIASSGLNLRTKDIEALLKRAKLETIEKLMLPSTPAELRALMGLSVFKSPSMLPDFFLRDLVNKLYTENKQGKLGLLKGLTIGGDDEPVNISPIDQDVLILWGEQDQIFPLQMATELKQLLGEQVRLEVIKDASHVPQIEKPMQFNNVVLNFLTATSKPNLTNNC